MEVGRAEANVLMEWEAIYLVWSLECKDKCLIDE